MKIKIIGIGICILLAITTISVVSSNDVSSLTKNDDLKTCIDGKIMSRNNNINLNINPYDEPEITYDDVTNIINSDLDDDYNLLVYLDEHDIIVENISEYIMNALIENPELIDNVNELVNIVEDNITNNLHVYSLDVLPETYGLSWYDVIRDIFLRWFIPATPSITVQHVEDISDDLIITTIVDTGGTIYSTTVELRHMYYHEGVEITTTYIVGIVGSDWPWPFAWPWTTETFDIPFSSEGGYILIAYPTILKDTGIIRDLFTNYYTVLREGCIPEEVILQTYVDDDFDQTTEGWGITHFDNIQNGIDGVMENGDVYVYNGIYYENIFIDKTLNLIGEDKDNTIIDGGGVDFVVYISDDANGINICKFTIRNGGNSGILILSDYINIHENNIIENQEMGIVISSNNNIITENIILNNDYGIHISGLHVSSDNNIISDNIISNNTEGIYTSSNYNIITRNTFSYNNRFGCDLTYSEYNTITDNIFVSNGITIRDGYLESWNTHTIENNTANDKPIRYYKNMIDIVVPINTAQVILANCTNVTIQNLNISHVDSGVQLGFSSNNIILNNTIMDNTYRGMYLTQSSNNEISYNIITNHNYNGIRIHYSSHNNFSYNTIENSFLGFELHYGSYNIFNENNLINSMIVIFFSNNNVFLNNIIEDRIIGIHISQSDNNDIIMNTIKNNYYGIIIRGAHANNIIMNDIINNSYCGIEIVYGYNGPGNNNTIYHNNFIDNNQNAFDECNNTWDNGYPSGGNYWDDYTGSDADGDGIGDTPYDISGSDNKDNYPLMKPYGSTTNLDEYMIYVLDNYDPDYDNPPFNDTLTFINSSNNNIDLVVSGFNTCQTIGGSRQLVSCDNGNACLVNERVADRMTKYDKNGNIIFTVDMALSSIDISNDGNIYAISGNRLYLMDSNGDVINSTITTSSNFDLVIDDDHNAVWIVGNDIKKFDKNLELQFAIDPIEWYAVSVDFTTTGDIWIAEGVYGSLNRLLKISPSGEIVKIVNLSYRPDCIRVDRNDDSLWVASGYCSGDGLSKYDNNGILLFSIDRNGWSIEVNQIDSSIWVAGKGDVEHYSQYGILLDTIHGFSEDDAYVAFTPKITTIPESVYVDDDYDETTQGWQINHFDNIQDGIDVVNEYGDVYVYNGIYYENVVVNKTINLIGEDRNTTIIDGGGSGDVVSITADRVNISLFTVQNSGTIVEYDGGIYVRSDYNIIYNNIVSNNNDGIRLVSSSNNNISGNTISLNYNDHGISLYDSSINNNISYNIILNNAYGIFFANSDGNTIIGNTISNKADPSCNLGIHFEYSNGNTITGNNIVSNAGHGISFRDSYNNNIICNTISDNDDGISIEESSNNNISGNTISNNDNGIYLMDSYIVNNTITGNTILNNYYGIFISDFVINNNIIYNNYFDNTNNAYDEGNNVWNVTKTHGINIMGGLYLGGNYWSDYFGNDLDGDGLGDIPYISGNVQDNHPLMIKSNKIQNLDTEEYFNTIQSAIDDDDTLDGHTIYVKNGTYYENVVIINKSLNLIGEDRNSTIIDANGIGDVVFVEDVDSFTISGFGITGSNSWEPTHNVGIRLSRSSNSSIINNKVYDNGGPGIYLCAIQYDYNSCNNNIVRDNIITNGWAGIRLIYTYNAIIHDNFIDSSRFVNIRICGSRYNTIYRNYIQNAGTDGFQIVDFSDDNLIFENTIINNYRGVQIKFGSSMSGNKIYHNMFINNQIQAKDYQPSSSNQWDNGYPSGGNYWGYSGTDEYNGPNQDILGSDNIIDDPYVFSGNQDNYPLVYPFISGDLNLDGIIDNDDFIEFQSAFGHSEGDPEYNPDCDYDNDGQITFVDYQIWLQYYRDYR